jgi:hypothetical protein
LVGRHNEVQEPFFLTDGAITVKNLKAIHPYPKLNRLTVAASGKCLGWGFRRKNFAKIAHTRSFAVGQRKHIRGG